MLERASGQFTIDGQVEDILGGISGAARIARISQSCRFSGELDGESMAEFTAVLPRDGDGSFHGFQRVSGTLGEREGTFVLSVTGSYVNGQPRGAWTIVPKSGSGDFVHIRGEGTFSLPNGKPGNYRLEFDLRKPRKARAVEQDDASADELVPDIAVVAEALEPVDVAPTEKPQRRRRVTAEPIVQPPVLDRPSEKPVRRKRTPPDTVTPAPTAEKQPEAKPKRTRAKPPAPAEQPVKVAASGPPEKQSTAKRTRTKPTDSEEANPTPIDGAAKAPVKRSRKAAEPAAPKPAPKKSVKPTVPVSLPVTSEKPARKRSAKAA